MTSSDNSLKDMSIVIVDDEPAITRLFQRILERYGYRNVTTVSSGMEALEHMQLLRPASLADSQDISMRARADLLLVDIMLPDISGYEVCRRLKKRINEFLPVLLLTGLNIEDNNARFVESGADDFLLKPTRPDTLMERVESLLKRRLKFLVESSSSDMAGPDGAMPRSGQHIGNWRIEKTLSWSGATIVFGVVDNHGKRAAMKMLTSQAREYEDVCARFVKEADLMMALKHDSIVQVYERGGYESSPWYVMEFIDGPNIEKLLAHSGVQSMVFNHRVATDLAAALCYVHDQGIIHRDLKLNNLYVKKDGTIKLADFGIATQLGDTRLTQQGYAIGTPLYMAPEQFAGGPITMATDIYSYGVTIYHLLTGHPPFAASNAMELMRRHLLEPPPPISQCRPDLPQGWDALICDRCLAKSAANRPASMQEVLEGLAELDPQLAVE